MDDDGKFTAVFLCGVFWLLVCLDFILFGACIFKNIYDDDRPFRFRFDFIHRLKMVLSMCTYCLIADCLND